jgi:hypothetical protein
LICVFPRPPNSIRHHIDRRFELQASPRAAKTKNAVDEGEITQIIDGGVYELCLIKVEIASKPTVNATR